MYYIIKRLGLPYFLNFINDLIFLGGENANPCRVFLCRDLLFLLLYLIVATLPGTVQCAGGCFVCALEMPLLKTSKLAGGVRLSAGPELARCAVADFQKIAVEGGLIAVSDAGGDLGFRHVGVQQQLLCCRNAFFRDVAVRRLSYHSAEIFKKCAAGHGDLLGQNFGRKGLGVIHVDIPKDRFDGVDSVFFHLIHFFVPQLLYVYENTVKNHQNGGGHIFYDVVVHIVIR